ncbi:MAG: hypothetical protein GTN93_19935 [Anaerolineae bacterium]|nr:hypothetical protein [Anaerolineae bacterium]
MLREVGPATLELTRRNGAFYLNARVSMNGDSWETVAIFPPDVEEEARFQFERIQTPNDLEDLVRAWTPEEVWESYQYFRRAYGF